jgi:hypothetical protein
MPDPPEKSVDDQDVLVDVAPAAPLREPRVVSSPEADSGMDATPAMPTVPSPQLAPKLGAPKPAPAAGPPAKSARKTFLATGSKTSSRSKTQLAPSAALPDAPAASGADDVLAPAHDKQKNPDILPDTARINLPPQPAAPKAAAGGTKAAAPPGTERKPTPRHAVTPATKERTAPAAKKSAAALLERTILPVNQEDIAPPPSVAASSPSPTEIDLDLSLDDETLADEPLTPTLPSQRSPVALAPRPMSRRRPRALGKYVVAVLVVGLVGAGGYLIYSFLWGGPSRRPVFAAEGVVLFQGKPATGARITLIPIEKSRDRYFPTGKVGADGTFKLTTYEPDDGAPVGKYKVTIVRGQLDAEEYAELSKKMSPQEVARVMQKLARDPLYQKYANPQKSGLTAEITNQLLNRLERFDLK